MVLTEKLNRMKKDQVQVIGGFIQNNLTKKDMIRIINRKMTLLIDQPYPKSSVDINWNSSNNLKNNLKSLGLL